MNRYLVNNKPREGKNIFFRSENLPVDLYLQTGLCLVHNFLGFFFKLGRFSFFLVQRFCRKWATQPAILYRFTPARRQPLHLCGDLRALELSDQRGGTVIKTGQGFLDVIKLIRCHPHHKSSAQNVSICSTTEHNYSHFMGVVSVLSPLYSWRERLES